MITKINELKEELSFFQEELEKYEDIIEIGKSSKPLEEKYKIEENLIQGCTSKLWLVCEYKDNSLVFHTDSDTVIVRGLAKIIENIFSNQKAKDILSFQSDILKSLGLTQIITPNRQNGIGNMINKIQKLAKEKI
jgi:cysteine desulfuration protein SufE